MVIYTKDLLGVKPLNKSYHADLTILKGNYPVVDTKEDHFYDNFLEIPKPNQGDDFSGTDSSFKSFCNFSIMSFPPSAIS